jgi:hypothetical protein
LNEFVLKERTMEALQKRRVDIFVDRSRPQWIVRDPEGNFWLVPSAENPWDQRQPFQPTEQTDLEPIPGHYRDMLGLPF